MADINKKISELESAISNAESQMIKPEHQKASFLSGIDFTNKVYIIGALIPVILFAGFYFIKPKFVLDKKDRVNYMSIGKYVIVLTLVLWACLYGAHYYGYV